MYKRISALERERDSIRVVLDGERKRSSDLAQVIMVNFVDYFLD